MLFDVFKNKIHQTYEKGRSLNIKNPQEIKLFILILNNVGVTFG